jgi:hypothetical protein
MKKILQHSVALTGGGREEENKRGSKQAQTLTVDSESFKKKN